MTDVRGNKPLRSRGGVSSFPRNSGKGINEGLEKHCHWQREGRDGRIRQISHQKVDGSQRQIAAPH